MFSIYYFIDNNTSLFYNVKIVHSTKLNTHIKEEIS